MTISFKVAGGGMVERGNASRRMWTSILSVVIFSLGARGREPNSQPRDIRKLSQDFIDPKGGLSPWTFYPSSNIKTLSAADAPGLLKIQDAGKGSDIKGVPEKPIRIDDYPLPWEFQMGFLQPEPKAGDEQTNYAFGVNVAVTFSDPGTWPADRAQASPDTHSLQLFVVRMGNYGEIYRDGVPQLRYSPLNYGDPSPEAYLVYGRGDLAPNAVGDWRIPYVWLGYQPPKHGQLGAAFGWSWAKYAGPAENNGLQDIRFRVRTLSPTQLEVGFGFGPYRGWRMRTIDVSHFGRITGIWEIGPIISLDRWMGESMAPTLGIHPTPELDPPKTGSAYYLDYVHFFGEGPENFDHLSVDFDIPSVPPDEKWFIEGDGIAETWSHPGYLTMTFSGKDDSWAMCPALAGEMTAGLGYIKLSEFKPPLELEIAFTAPDDSVAWNFWHSFSLTDEAGKGHSWAPGVQNIPGRGRVYINEHPTDALKIESNAEINVEFEKQLQQSVLDAKPLRMLIQIVDAAHLRVGFRGGVSDSWYLSKTFDTAKVFGRISKFQLPCPVSFLGLKNSRVGNYPHHLQFLIDYVHYRYGLSTSGVAKRE